MSKLELKQILEEQSHVKWSTVEEHLSEKRIESLQEQLKGVTMTTDDDGDTVVPSRDLRKAITNPGETV